MLKTIRKQFNKTKVVILLLIASGSLLFFLFNLASPFFETADDESNQGLPLNSTYEPSAAQQLSSGRVIVLEDEVSRALNLISFDSSGYVAENSIVDQELTAQLTEDFDDLEGITLSDTGDVYATTSFSRTSKGKRRPNREKLLRLTLNENDKLVSQQVYTDFVDALKTSGIFKSLSKLGEAKPLKLKDLNIEGLSFDADQQQLLFGLKKPLINDLSIIIRMENPKKVLDGDETPVFSEQLTLLDLNEGGIRSLEYDRRLKGYLIANEVNFGGGPKQSQLWFWSGDEQSQAIALVLPEIAGMENIEAITSVSIGAESKVLVMSDDGSRRSKRPAHYQLIDYADISAQIQ